MKSPDSNTPKHVLITGGTGSVGRALCETFSRSGYHVTFQYARQGKRAQVLAKELGATAWQCDFEHPFKLPAPHFDVLVNNAAVNISDELTADVTNASWDRTLQVNVTAPFLLTKQCLPWMTRHQWGRIINISSIYGVEAVEGNCPYTASKHALNGLTKTVAKEYGSSGVTCNAICPGAIESEMMQRIASQNAEEGATAEDYLQAIRKANPTGRMCTPEDVARLAIFLASTDAAHINGAMMPIDGGTIA